MAKAKVRTKAQRRAAALESWRLRRLRTAEKPAKNLSVVVDFDRPKSPYVMPKPDFIGEQMRDFVGSEPTTIGATKEGHEYFVTITQAGSLFRHRVSVSAMRKLGMDCLTLTG